MHTLGVWRIATIVIGTASLVAAIAGAAVADPDQSGRESAAHSFDGDQALVDGHSFNPDSGQCALYSTLAYQAADNRQIEGGVVRCNGTAVDGSCDDVKFIETWTGGDNYNCHAHGSFTNATYYTIKFKRHGTAFSSTFDSYIGSTQEESLGGFDYTNTMRLWAWGEHTPSSNCSGWGPAVGYFENWQHFYYGGSGWDYNSGTAWSGCWNVSSIDSTGDFHVTK